MSGEAFDEVLFEERGALGLITLNRPKALNALTEAMCIAIDAQLVRWRDSDGIKAVVIRGSGERAFCAGGDIRALYSAGRSGGDAATDFYRHEYRMNARIKHFPKPYIALLHGIVMGGGVGVSIHGSHRIVDANTTFAMPETGIGMFPDVGGSYFLPRLPGEIGMYLALTGARLKTPDLAYSGIATHSVSSVHWEMLIDRLAAGDTPEAALAGLTGGSGTPALTEFLEVIDRCFAHGSVEAILAALDEDESAWGPLAATTIRMKSPTSVKISFRELREGRQLEFDDCLRMEFRMVARVMAGHDFFEGVRATIIDKDNEADWRPETLPEVTDSDVDAHFAPLGQKELQL
ncbi:MAG TPA: enoyl-CoA hydratase/isomerase family protein [Rhizomicrobium sp.]|jgi:enoyl-CoA hydratase|nr:enoyl-CoA hydratase/isomerase family protein [Rhizomicrobium sp.]